MVRTTITKKGKQEPLAAQNDAHREMLPRTGMNAGALFVDAASKFLASYGKILGPVVILTITAFVVFYIVQARSSSAEVLFRNEIDKAAQVAKFEELRPAMEVVIAKADEEGELQAYARYRHAMRAFQLLERPYKADQLKAAIAVFDDYLSNHGEDEAHVAWKSQIEGLRTRLNGDLEFLQKPDNTKLLPWDHHSKADKPATKEVADANPIVVFVTSIGTVKFELFEDDAPNAVKHFLSLVDEGYYDRVDFSAQSFSNHFSASGQFKNATVISAGREGRPRGVELEKPTDAKKEDDVDTVAVKNPYTIEYTGSTTKAFRPGSISLARDTDDPLRARGEFFITIEPSATIDLNFDPLGQLVDDADGNALKVARRLHSAEIYYTYVEQKRPGVKYMPEVYYDGWPVPTTKRDKTPDPVRFSKVDLVIDDKANPLVVIEMEKGDIVIELFEDVCPNTVKNFINLVEEGFFNQECEFYRVEGTGTDIAEIYRGSGARIIQGGFDQSQKRDGYDYGIKNEAVTDAYKAAGLRNSRGTVAMARTDQLDSASTEFFINLKEFPQWDSESSPYCVFGEVIYGLDVVAGVTKDDEIKSAKVIRKRSTKYVPEVKYTSATGFEPKKPVTIPKVEDDKKDDKKDE